MSESGQLMFKGTFCLMTYLGESTVVPKVTFVGEAVADETKLALLDILLL